jgi:ADP-ribose pyrophosphatase YjhB (NUDIX family)
MYKIFINDKPFIITSEDLVDKVFAKFSRFNYVPQDLKKYIKNCVQLSTKGVVLITDDVESTFKDLYTYFVPIKAAGGIVFNKSGQLLLIKRMGKWDLPKGKVDAGEMIEDAAIREVVEECGISGLVIESKAPTTFHSYKVRGFDFLKITNWYIMHTGFDGDLIPQTEEMITDVKWQTINALDIDKLDTYESIKDLLKMVIR